MITLLFGLVFAALTVCVAVLYHAYGRFSPRELKRRARRGDEVAALLYRTVAYGLSSRLLLAALGVIAGYLALALLYIALGPWTTGLLVIAIGVGAVLFVRSNGGAGKVSLWLAARVSPGLGWLVERLDPLFEAIANLLRRFFPVHVHTGVYEKEDFAELLAKQKSQPDNRIAHGEIDLLTHALSFGDKTVQEILIPKRVVKSVALSDATGPVLMGELHATGHSRFPVYDGKKDNIVGVLYLHDLVDKKHGGKVSDSMRTPVRYAHEDFTLYETLRAFLKTKQHLFVVVNSFEEYVGIITIEDVLEQIIGTKIVDEFDQYDDLRAVATHAARKEHSAHQKHEVAAEATPEKTEVVE